MTLRKSSPALVALLVGGLLVPAPTGAQTSVIPPQAPGGNAEALARVRAERASAEQALTNAADPRAAAAAADRLRQITAAQIAVETNGQSPEQAAQTISRISQDAQTRAAAIEKTSKQFLTDRLSSATSDAEKAGVWRSFDATMTQLRVTQEVTAEAVRRMNPVATPTGFDPARRENFNATQYRMDQLLDSITKSHVEEPRLPSYTNPDGSRASALDREIEEHRRQTQRDADIQEYIRLAEAGVFVNPQTGDALSQELRDRIAKNAKLQLADVLKARGFESGAVRTLFGWTDSRDALGQQIEGEVRNNSWYRALDMLNPTVTGADPQMIALAMANVLNLSANQIEAWRTGQIPEGGEGGVTGWLYENFVAKQKTGLGTAMRVSDLEKGGAIDQMLTQYRADVDAAVAALNEMAKTPDPSQLSAENHQLLDSMGFISKVDGRESYRVPTGDTAQRLQRKLNLPGASMLDLISSANMMKIVVMVALPELAAARVGTAIEGLELGMGAIRTGEFVTNVLANAAMDAAFQKIETGTVQWDRVALDAVVVNLGLGVAGQITGGASKAIITGTMSAEARAVAQVIGKNPAAHEMAESMLRQVLGLTTDSALLTYWQSKFQGTGMSYDDFLANMLNGVAGRLAPIAGRVAKEKVATGIGLWAPRTLRDGIFGMSPELRDAFIKGLTPEGLARYVETGRVATQEAARKESADRLRSALGEDVLKLDLNDPRLVEQVTRALETGQLTFADMKAVLGETPSLNTLMDGINANRIKTFDTIIATARQRATGEILAEFDARMERFKEALGPDSPQFKEAERVATGWRDAELAKLNDKVEAPGSKNNTSDIDRSITSTYLRDALKVTIDEVFRRNTGADRVATSAAAYDVNEYFNIFKVIERMQRTSMDLRTVTHDFVDGMSMSHADYMASMNLATRMLDMNAGQRDLALQNRTRTGDAARDAQIQRKAEESLNRAESELNQEVARLAKEGYDPNNPDTITRARDNLYGRRASELAHKEATLARLDPNSPYARQLAAEIQAEWAMTKREGIEAYTNFTGLDIVVKKGQMRNVTARELIEGRVDQAALDAANAKRRKDGDPERTATQQQELIDQSLREIRSEYRPEDMQGAIDDQVRFITHHLNGYFQGHESATQAASALSKYIERVILFTTLAGNKTTTGPIAELNAMAADLVRNRGNLENLTRLITQLGNGDANAGMRRITGLVEAGIPGLKGMFDPALITGLTPSTTGPGRTSTGPGAASLTTFLRQREAEREDMRQRTGSASVAQAAQQEKAQQEAELAKLQAEKANDDRLATQYNRSDWRLARDLEAQIASLAMQLNALPFNNTATATYKGLTDQLRSAQTRLEALKKNRTPTGAAPTEGDQVRDRRIASLQEQIKHTDAAITHYQTAATREAADAASRVQTGSSTFNPLNDSQRALVTTGRPSSTPELDKVGAELAKIWNEPPPPYTAPEITFKDPPPPRIETGGSNAILNAGIRDNGAQVTIRPDTSLSVRVGTITYPGMFGPNGGFMIWAPNTPIDLNAPPPNPIATTQPSAVPTGNMTTNPDGSVTFGGVPITGLPGSNGPGTTTSPLPGSISFTPTPGRGTNGPTTTGGGGGGGGSSTVGGIGGYPFDTNGLGPQPGMGFGESESFEPNPETPMTSITDGPTGTFVDGGGGDIDLGGGTLTGDPGGCCTPGVQVLSLDFGDPATVNPTTQTREDAALRLSLPRMAKNTLALLKFIVQGTNATAASRTLALANEPIGMPPAFTAPELSELYESEGGQTATANPIQTFLVSNGNSQGEAFDMQIVNTGSKPVKVFGTGVVIEPIKKELQQIARQQMTKLIGSGANVLTRKVEAYCLQYALAPPSPGMLFQIASPAMQGKFKPAGMIMTAARQLAAAGAMNPDSNPKSYLDSIKQYAIWTKFENWDMKKFGDVLLEKTKAAATAAKANWTGQMQTALLSAVPNRWRDIQTVLSAAQELAARPQQ